MSRKTVLIVDDLAFVRTTLSELLSEAGYDVVAEAADGEEAIEKWEKHRPDLVTMDVVMPRMNGIEATKEIMKADRNAVIVMISSMDQVHLVMDAIHVGAKDYIQKPFHSQEVLSVLDRAIRGEEPPSSRDRAARVG
jgi:two-component system chemotaxis response regulator CheY